ncbi:MAG: hypothetical protein N2202_01575 [Proteobacteria bacterium]|nr:hypothetical protein [Pseudomonadota bacterium]
MSHVLKRILFLIYLIIPSFLFAQEINTTITNRLTKITLNFNTENPIKSTPIFLSPENSLIVNQLLTTTFKGQYLNRLDLYCIFEKEGRYELGPFVFHDLLGGSVSVNKVSIEVRDDENIVFNDVKQKSQDAPPKFYTIIPHKDFYKYMPAYLIVDVPSTIKEMNIFWPGWEGVIVEKVEERLKKDGRREIIYSAIFTKEGKYNLAPLKIAVKNFLNKELMFSTSTLKFDVKEIKQGEEKFLIGDYSIKINPYTATENNAVQIDISVSGTGFLEQIKPINLEVSPSVEVFLKEDKKDYFSKFPEYRGNNNFTYFFIPPSDGVYTIKTPSLQIFNPINNSFKNLSSFTRTVKVHIPSNPVSKEKEDYEKNLNIRIRPDYDFYLFLGFFVFVTITTIVLYVRSKKTQRKELKEESKKSEGSLNLSSVQRSILIALEKITNEELLLSSPSKVRNALDKTYLPVDLKEEITQWLYESYQTLYLKNKDDKELIDRGLSLLKKIAKATEER